MYKTIIGKFELANLGRRLALAAAVLGSLISMPAGAQTRVKDIAVVQGVRGNQLVGYGLVAGLAGTGDSQQVAFTLQSVASMLQKLGVSIPATALRLKNIAAVMVTADLPPFVKNGSTIDVTVSSIGDAASLLGGTLVQCPLQAANGEVYAVAQGSISVGGYSAGGSSSGSVTQNHVTAGRIPSGAIVERDVPTTLETGNNISITLNQPDFTTAVRMAAAINKQLPQGAIAAHAMDAATVQVSASPGVDPVAVIAGLEELDVTTDTPAKVIIDERTGTVVLGGNVTVSACAIAHGNLTIRVADATEVSQPKAFSQGSTVTVPRKDISVQEGTQRLIPIATSSSIDKVVRALNALGVSPRDLISILQAMKEAGALHADVEVR